MTPDELDRAIKLIHDAAETDASFEPASEALIKRDKDRLRDEERKRVTSRNPEPRPWEIQTVTVAATKRRGSIHNE